MTFTLELLTWLTGCAMTTVYLCEAESLPSPTGLSHKWLDPFTVNVSWSWKKPPNLPDGCNIMFEHGKSNEEHKKSHWKNFSESCFTEEDSCIYNIKTVGSEGCKGWNPSVQVRTNVTPQKLRAEVVKDFKCFLDNSGMNCTWIPVNPGMTLSYRSCGITETSIKSLRQCDRKYTSGERDGCYLNVKPETEVCINAATVTEAMTFKPLKVLHSPKLTVSRNNSYLILSWQPVDVGNEEEWKRELCFKKCGEKQECLNISERVYKITYKESCSYEFKSRILPSKYTLQVSSDFGDIVAFGVTKPPDQMLTLVAVIVPIILSVFVFLSCYCFRRHSHIIFPTIPDPRVILKGMMNGNKELKFTTGKVYTPQPEHTESCKLVRENCDSPQSP